MEARAEERTLGHYIIDEKIAQGGMAEIFRGRARAPDGIERPVVIKRILPHIAASEEFVEMLIQEAKLAVQLSHGNIAQVYDLGRIGADYFIVMEYVDGISLSRIARRLRQTQELMPIPVALYIASEVASGLEYMHNKTDSRGQPLHIVHRDISPQNIMIAKSGTLKIIDFGIAKAESQVSTTDSGVVKGKFAYMSPEHVHGEKLDARADIFSLGVILWELLTNQRLFKGKNNKETIQRVKRCRIPSVRGYRKDLPKAVEQIVKRALAKQLKNRYQSAHDLLLALIRALVTYYPDFAPKDLEHYVREIFADYFGEEPTLVERTGAQEAPTELEEREEITALANPAIFQKRLADLEAYHVKGAAAPKTAAEAAAPPTPTAPRWREWLQRSLQALQSLPWQESWSLLRRAIRRFRKALVITGGGLAIAAGIYWGSDMFIEWMSRPAGTPETVDAEKSVPSPERKEAPPAQEAGVATAALIIRSDPRGAEIYLNDKRTGKRTPADLEELVAGQSYRIGLFKAPYRYWEQTVQLKADERRSLNAQLEINYGGMNISSYPQGARIWIDEKEQGLTPLRVEKLEPDKVYQVRIELPDYKPWSHPVKIFPGKTAMVRATLEEK